MFQLFDKLVEIVLPKSLLPKSKSQTTENFQNQTFVMYDPQTEPFMFFGIILVLITFIALFIVTVVKTVKKHKTFSNGMLGLQIVLIALSFPIPGFIIIPFIISLIH